MAIDSGVDIDICSLMVNILSSINDSDNIEQIQDSFIDFKLKMLSLKKILQHTILSELEVSKLKKLSSGTLFSLFTGKYNFLTTSTSLVTQVLRIILNLLHTQTKQNHCVDIIESCFFLKWDLFRFNFLALTAAEFYMFMSDQQKESFQNRVIEGFHDLVGVSKDGNETVYYIQQIKDIISLSVEMYNLSEDTIWLEGFRNFYHILHDQQIIDFPSPLIDSLFQEILKNSTNIHAELLNFYIEYFSNLGRKSSKNEEYQNIGIMKLSKLTDSMNIGLDLRFSLLFIDLLTEKNETKDFIKYTNKTLLGCKLLLLTLSQLENLKSAANDPQNILTTVLRNVLDEKSIFFLFMVLMLLAHCDIAHIIKDMLSVENVHSFPSVDYFESLIVDTLVAVVEISTIEVKTRLLKSIIENLNNIEIESEDRKRLNSRATTKSLLLKIWEKLSYSNLSVILSNSEIMEKISELLKTASTGLFITLLEPFLVSSSIFESFDGLFLLFLTALGFIQMKLNSVEVGVEEDNCVLIECFCSIFSYCLDQPLQEENEEIMCSAFKEVLETSEKNPKFQNIITFQLSNHLFLIKPNRVLSVETKENKILQVLLNWVENRIKDCYTKENHENPVFSPLNFVRFDATLDGVDFRVEKDIGCLIILSFFSRYTLYSGKNINFSLLIIEFLQSVLDKNNCEHGLNSALPRELESFLNYHQGILTFLENGHFKTLVNPNRINIELVDESLGEFPRVADSITPSLVVAYMALDGLLFCLLISNSQLELQPGKWKLLCSSIQSILNVILEVLIVVCQDTELSDHHSIHIWYNHKLEIPRNNVNKTQVLNSEKLFHPSVQLLKHQISEFEDRIITEEKEIDISGAEVKGENVEDDNCVSLGLQLGIIEHSCHTIFTILNIDSKDTEKMEYKFEDLKNLLQLLLDFYRERCTVVNEEQYQKISLKDTVRLLKKEGRIIKNNRKNQRYSFKPRNSISHTNTIGDINPKKISSSYVDWSDDEDSDDSEVSSDVDRLLQSETTLLSGLTANDGSKQTTEDGCFFSPAHRRFLTSRFLDEDLLEETVEDTLEVEEEVGSGVQEKGRRVDLLFPTFCFQKKMLGKLPTGVVNKIQRWDLLSPPWFRAFEQAGFKGSGLKGERRRKRKNEKKRLVLEAKSSGKKQLSNVRREILKVIGVLLDKLLYSKGDEQGLEIEKVVEIVEFFSDQLWKGLESGETFAVFKCLVSLLKQGSEYVKEKNIEFNENIKLIGNKFLQMIFKCEISQALIINSILELVLLFSGEKGFIELTSSVLSSIIDDIKTQKTSKLVPDPKRNPDENLKNPENSQNLNLIVISNVPLQVAISYTIQTFKIYEELDIWDDSNKESKKTLLYQITVVGLKFYKEIIGNLTLSSPNRKRQLNEKNENLSNFLLIDCFEGKLDAQIISIFTKIFGNLCKEGEKLLKFLLILRKTLNFLSDQNNFTLKDESEKEKEILELSKMSEDLNCYQITSFLLYTEDHKEETNEENKNFMNFLIWLNKRTHGISAQKKDISLVNKVEGFKWKLAQILQEIQKPYPMVEGFSWVLFNSDVVLLLTLLLGESGSFLFDALNSGEFSSKKKSELEEDFEDINSISVSFKPRKKVRTPSSTPSIPRSRNKVIDSWMKNERNSVLEAKAVKVNLREEGFFDDSYADLEDFIVGDDVIETFSDDDDNDT